MNREKQIEEIDELQTVLYEANHKKSVLDYRWLATEAYNTGYRKQNKNTVELPCKVGDIVYRLKKRRGVWCILPREVISITYRLDHLHRVVWEIFSTETDVLGRSVFLTEEEAEQFLTKMKGGAK